MTTQTETPTTPQILIPPEMPPVAKHLFESRALLARRRGWGKGHYYENGARCALGALGNYGDRSRVVDSNVQFEASDYLKRMLPQGYYSVVTYNDMPERRKRDILRLYDRAIALALKKGM